MKKFEIHDLLRYFHNAKKRDGSLFPILCEDALALTASLSYLLEDTNFCVKAYSGTGKSVLMEAIFNLLPLNPLDGSRILPLIVKNPRTLYNIEFYGPRILIGLIILNLIGIPILSTIILTPVSIIFYLLTGA